MAQDLPHEDAARRLHSGGVLAYATEGVWGIGCDPGNEAAVLRLLEIKHRDVAKGLILIAGDESQLSAWVDFNALLPEHQARVRATWPGPNTWIVPARAAAPRWITGKHDSIAVRVTAHPDVIALCQAFNGPLVSTSANFSGQPAARHRLELDPALVATLDGTVAGETGGLQSPSVIRDARTGAVLRA